MTNKINRSSTEGAGPSRTRPHVSRSIAVLAGLVLVIMGPRLRAQPTADGIQFFENKIRPVFAKHCYECHSEGAKKVKGGLKLDTKEDFLKGGTDGVVVKPGDPEASRLIKAIRYHDKDLRDRRKDQRGHGEAN